MLANTLRGHSFTYTKEYYVNGSFEKIELALNAIFIEIVVNAEGQKVEIYYNKKHGAIEHRLEMSRDEYLATLDNVALDKVIQVVEGLINV